MMHRITKISKLLKYCASSRRLIIPTINIVSDIPSKTKQMIMNWIKNSDVNEAINPEVILRRTNSFGCCISHSLKSSPINQPLNLNENKEVHNKLGENLLSVSL